MFIFTFTPSLDFYSQSIQVVGSVKVPIQTKNVHVPMLQGAIATRYEIIARCT
jgi:hypothetical protein